MRVTRNKYCFQSATTKRRAFSLVEVILALAIFSMAIGGIIGILASSARSVGDVTSRSTSIGVAKYITSLIDQAVEAGSAGIIVEGISNRLVIEDGSDIDSIFPLRFNAECILVQLGGSDLSLSIPEVQRIPVYFVDRIDHGSTSANSVVQDVAERVELEVVWPWGNGLANEKTSEPTPAQKNKLSQFRLSHVVILR